MPTTTPASSRPSGRSRSRRRRRSTSLVALVLLVVAAAACEPPPPDTDPPRWTIGGKPVETALGPHVKLSWPAATGDPTRYRIDANGVTATMLTPGTATSCVMVGLAANTAYTFKITAYDAAGNWSGSLPNAMDPPGFRAAGYTTPAGPGGGPTLRCVPVTDTDGDRLPDTLETGTGTYSDTAATGTSPTVVDTDVDGLADGDEVLGSPGGLDLYALGARPMRPDLLLEVDWASGFAPGSPCPGSDLTPQAAWFTGAVDGFAAMDLPGPGGSAGVHLIVDHGQGGVFTGGTSIPDADGVLGGPPTDLAAVNVANLAADRVGYFHHLLIAPRIHSFGVAQSRPFSVEGGSRIWIPTCGVSDAWGFSADVMHELGHNLELDHGGGREDEVNYKPSYNSVMNYMYYDGLDLDCDAWPDGGPGRRLGYSDGGRPSLDEAHIVEADGVCGDVPYDFNRNNVIDSAPYALDLNRSGGSIEVLHDHDDLANLDLAAFTDDDRMGSAEVIYETGP